MAKGTCGIEGCTRPHTGRRAPRRHHFDETFFDEITTEVQAYWLGFITADGCVRSDGKFNLLQIRLKDSDAPHIEKFKVALRATYPIRFSPRRGVAGPSAAIALTSRHAVDSLADLGVTPRKSLTATPWQGPEHLMRHYWRGMVDGDGSIGRRTGRNGWVLDYCGSLQCVEAFAEWARGVRRTAGRLYSGSNVWHWKVAGLAAPQAIVRELYAGSSVHLDRKFALAQELMSQTPIIDLVGRPEVCVVEGCLKAAVVHSMCRPHYRRTWVAGNPACVVEGCTRKQSAGRYCATHYARLRRSGTTDLRPRGR